MGFVDVTGDLCFSKWQRAGGNATEALPALAPRWLQSVQSMASTWACDARNLQVGWGEGETGRRGQVSRLGRVGGGSRGSRLHVTLLLGRRFGNFSWARDVKAPADRYSAKIMESANPSGESFISGYGHGTGQAVSCLTAARELV